MMEVQWTQIKLAYEAQIIQAIAAQAAVAALPDAAQPYEDFKTSSLATLANMRSRAEEELAALQQLSPLQETTRAWREL